MKEIQMNIKFEHTEARTPAYKHTADAGADLYAVEEINIMPGTVGIVNTGVVFDIPAGYEVQIRSRSGLAAKNAVFVLNSPGTIDSGYLDPIKIILFNAGSTVFSVKIGDRVAQAVCSPVTRMNFTVVDDIAETERGRAGLGSTGVSTPPIEM